MGASLIDLFTVPVKPVVTGKAITKSVKPSPVVVGKYVGRTDQIKSQPPHNTAIEITQGRDKHRLTIGSKGTVIGILSNPEEIQEDAKYIVESLTQTDSDGRKTQQYLREDEFKWI